MRPKMAEAAQRVYDEWDQDDEYNDFGDGGICDAIAQELQGVIASNIADANMTDGGQDGDDHAYTLVSDSSHQIFEVDIPPHVYERGGGYSWTKLPNIVFEPSDVLINKLNWNYNDIFEDTSHVYHGGNLK